MFDCQQKKLLIHFLREKSFSVTNIYNTQIYIHTYTHRSIWVEFRLDAMTEFVYVCINCVQALFEHSTHYATLHTVRIHVYMFEKRKKKRILCLPLMVLVVIDASVHTIEWKKSREKKTDWWWWWERGRKFFISAHSIISSTRSRTGVKIFGVLFFFFSFEEKKKQKIQ